VSETRRELVIKEIFWNAANDGHCCSFDPACDMLEVVRRFFEIGITMSIRRTSAYQHERYHRNTETCGSLHPG